MDKVEVKFGDWIQKGFDLYKENFGVLIVPSIIVVLLSALTLGILSGPLLVGMILITLRLLDKQEPKPSVGDVFQGFGQFVDAFLFWLVWGVITFVAAMILNLIPCLGQILSIVIIYAIQALLLFGLFLIADRRMQFWPASMGSIEKVKTNFWPFLGLAVVAGILGSLGLILCGIGVVLTFPIYICIVAVAYRDVFSGPETGGESVAQGVETQTPPPPPSDEPQA